MSGSAPQTSETGYEIPDERHRCACTPPAGRCKGRATQEDLLCDYCRGNELCERYASREAS